MKDTNQEYLSYTWTRVHLGPGMKKAPVLYMNVDEGLASNQITSHLEKEDWRGGEEPLIARPAQ